jgi:hypothetical protein
MLRFILKARFRNNGNLSVGNLVLENGVALSCTLPKHKMTFYVNCDIT